MIKFETHDGKVNLALNGTAIDITAEVLLLVSNVYNAFKENDEKEDGDIAECYKKAIMGSIDSAFKTSEELEANVNKAVEEQVDQLIKQLSALNDLLSK